MSLVIEHTEYLLRRHDCVTLPGIGALMVRYSPARFDSRNPLVLMPPSREIVFNGEIKQSDGLLETSVGRRCGVSFEAARRMIKEEAESLLHQLNEFKVLSLGRIGELTVSDYGSVVFSPGNVSDWDFRFYGLRPLYLKTADSVVNTGNVSCGTATLSASAEINNLLPAVDVWNKEEDNPSGRGRWARMMVGVAASLAVVVTLALFILNPIRMENEPLKASLAPVGRTEEPVSSGAREISGERPQEADMPEAAVDEDDAVAVSIPAEDCISVPQGENAGPMEAASESAKAVPSASGKETRKEGGHVAKFNDTDPFCVIVASFPDLLQAERYMAENPRISLGVLHQDGKYRVYAATGATYEEASAQKAFVNAQGAWICRR